MKKFLETSPTSRDIATVQELQIMVAVLRKSVARTEKNVWNNHAIGSFEWFAAMVLSFCEVPAPLIAVCYTFKRENLAPKA